MCVRWFLHIGETVSLWFALNWMIPSVGAENELGIVQSSEELAQRSFKEWSMRHSGSQCGREDGEKKTISQDSFSHWKEHRFGQDKALTKLRSQRNVPLAPSAFSSSVPFFPLLPRPLGPQCRFSPLISTTYSESLQYVSENMGYLLTTALASWASSLVDDGKSLHLTLREGERIYHAIFLASQKQYHVGKFQLQILVFVSPTGLFPSKPFEGSVCNPYFLIKTLLQFQPLH